MASLSDDEETLSDGDAIDLEATLTEDIITLDTDEFHLPAVDTLPTLESILGEEDAAPSPAHLQADAHSDCGSVGSATGPERTPSHLRYSPLAGVSAQLKSATERVSAGVPTALAAGAVIAVGTSHGLCLVFETNEAMRYCLGDVTAGQQLGAVSCLHVSADGTRLIAGYARGQVQVYDLTRGRLEMTIDEATPRGTSIIHIRLTDVPDVALVSDSGGSVFELGLRRLLGRRSAAVRCLFSGSRGEVVTFEPLPTADHPDHPLHQQLVVAMATMSKVIVVSMRPKLEVLFSHALEADPLHVPLLDWQFVVIRGGTGASVVDPVLTFARRSNVYFYQVSCPVETIKFVPLQWLEFPFTIENLHWMNSRTIALIDTQEKLQLWDVRGEQQLETLDLSHMKIVYSTSYFKGLASGGNVSKAMAVAGEKACYESCVASGGQLLLLGTRGVHALTLRTWLERLEAHVRCGEFSAALRLAWGLYGEHQRPMAGARSRSSRRQAIIRERMLSLIDEWLGCCLGSSGSEELLRQAVPICAQYLLDLGESKVLFGRIHSLLEPSPAGSAALLEWLQPHVVSGQVAAPPPLVMQQLVSHYEQLDRFQALEAALVRVDLASLDINQVLPLCWRHGLYDAIIRIHTVGMADYTSPLLEMLTRLAAVLEKGTPLTDEQAQLGNKLLVYISSCLAGRGYPDGDVPGPLVHKVKLAVLSTLTSVHSQDAAESELVYPHLRTLLRFDTREFLNVLSLSFEEDVFTSELGMRQRQRVVDILLALIIDSPQHSAGQVGALFTFIARQMTLPSSTVCVSRDLFDQVVDHLTVPGDTAHHEERQQVLSELISTGALQHYDTERLAQLAEAAKFYGICELLFERRAEYERKVDSLLRHPAGRATVHRYLRSRAAAESRGPAPVPDPPRDAASIALDHLQDLVDVDVDATADLFTSCLSRHLEAAVERLDSSSQQRLDFLAAVLRHSCSVVLPAAVYRLYLELLCRLQPDQVVDFLNTQPSADHDKYLEICRGCGSRRGQAYLLERSGDTAAALQALLDDLDSLDPQSDAARLRLRLTAAVELCQRSAGRLPDDERQQCWFSVLDRAVTLQRHSSQPTATEQPHTDNTGPLSAPLPLVAAAMIGHVPMADVMRRILQEPAFSGGKFGPLRPLITDLLRTCQYEQVLYDSVLRVVLADTVQGHVQKRRVWSRGNGAPARCHVCGLRPDLQQAQMLVFRCGHFCHATCSPELESAGRRCPVCPAPLSGAFAADQMSTSAAGTPTGDG